MSVSATEHPRGWVRRWPAWRTRLSVQELRDLGYPDLALLRLTRPDLHYFTPTDLRLLFRIQGPGLETGGEKLLMPPPRDGYRDVLLPWNLPDVTHGQLEPYETSVRPRAAVASPAPWWEAATRGWALGALVLVLIILIVRVAEKCADRQFFKFAGGRRERRSVEWPAPTVLATTHRQIQAEDLASSLEDTGAFSSERNVDNVLCDLPPPYSACANTETVINTPNKNTAAATDSAPNGEEPPPPYSACYVTYTNPKHGTSSLQFHNNQRIKVLNERDGAQAAHSSTSGDVSTGSDNCRNQNITERETNEVATKTGDTHRIDDTLLEGDTVRSCSEAEDLSVDVRSGTDESDGEGVTHTNNSLTLNRVMVV